MANSKALDERIRRVKLLFKELGFKVIGDERSENAFTAAFEGNSGTHGGFFIDRESRFLEIGYTFSFSQNMSEFLKDRLEEMLKVCYEFGCYTNIQKNKSEVNYSLFKGIYFSGLSYFSLKDSLRDFKRCVAITTELLDIQSEEDGEEL